MTIILPEHSLLSENTLTKTPDTRALTVTENIYTQMI